MSSRPSAGAASPMSTPRNPVTAPPTACPRRRTAGDTPKPISHPKEGLVHEAPEAAVRAGAVPRGGAGLPAGLRRRGARLLHHAGHRRRDPVLQRHLPSPTTRGRSASENEFHDWLEESGKDPSAADAWCYFGDTYRAAERDADRRMRSDRRSYHVVSTRWAPDSFTAQPLRDFHIEVSSGRREVRVCVRDHECEDGDKVRISVNGARVLSGEIDNDWDCKDVRVSEGRNRVELYAVNGSGNKGNCSYANVNTGELRVEGKNMETQSWRHRGGAGSSASIVVEVD